MPKRSSVELLDPTLKAQVDSLVRQGRTIDEVVEKLRELGDEQTSRSAVGRYTKRAKAQMMRYREAQEIAKVWIGKLEEDPNGDVGRLLSEMLRTVAFEQMGQLEDENGTVRPQDIMFLAKAIKELSSADKTSADRMLKIRDQVAKETAKKAATEAVKQAKKGGLTGEALEAIRAGILGIAA